MTAAQEPSPPTRPGGPKTERSEGELARTNPQGISISPDEWPDVKRFIEEMRAKKAVEEPSQATMVNAALLNSMMDLTKAINQLREAAQPMFDAHR